jgi:hypothetical protein
MDNNLFVQNDTIYNILLCDIKEHNKEQNKFDVNIYRIYNDDLKNLSEEELIKHYNYYGKFEKRITENPQRTIS